MSSQPRQARRVALAARQAGARNLQVFAKKCARCADIELVLNAVCVCGVLLG